MSSDHADQYSRSHLRQRRKAPTPQAPTPWRNGCYRAGNPVDGTVGTSPGSARLFTSEGAGFAPLPSIGAEAFDVDAESPALVVVPCWCGDRNDISDCKAQPHEPVISSLPMPGDCCYLRGRLRGAFGRSATNRAARISVSGELCPWPGKRLSVETRVLSASDVDNVARRAASSQGSTFIRANAERTLSRIPPGSSLSVQTERRRMQK